MKTNGITEIKSFSDIFDRTDTIYYDVVIRYKAEMEDRFTGEIRYSYRTRKVIIKAHNIKEIIEKFYCDDNAIVSIKESNAEIIDVTI